MTFAVLFSSVQPLDQLGHRGDMTDNAADSLSVFNAGGHCKQFWRGHECVLFDVVHPAFPLPTIVAHPPECPEGWFWRGCCGV